MATDRDEPLAGERMLEAHRNQQNFEWQRIADPTFARMPRWVPHRPWRATRGDIIMAWLGAVIVVVVIVVNLL